MEKSWKIKNVDLINAWQKASEKSKLVDVYGVQMTEVEEMYYSKYMQNSDMPAMNTIYKEERKEFAEKWLKNYRESIKKEIPTDEKKEVKSKVGKKPRCRHYKNNPNQTQLF